MSKNNKMLGAKLDWVAFISLWHYFCASEYFYSVYLTRINNKYTI